MEGAMKNKVLSLCGFLALIVSASSFGAIEGRPDRDKIVFAYLQSPTSNDIRGVRWHALTHIGWSFITFDADANLGGVTSFNNRSAELKPGGVASNNGVKVVIVLANQNFDESILSTVMTSATLRQKLIDNVVAVVSNPTTGCDGVNLDFEFSWGTSTRDGIAAFIQGLYTALKALTPPRELSIYTIPSWSSTQYIASNLTNYTDYVIYSGYDFASGTTMQSVGEYGTTSTYSIVGNLDDYIAAGIPPEHLVLGLPFYTKSWDTDASGTYGGTGTEVGADSLLQANYDTLYRNPPYTKYYSNPTNHHTKWYKRLISGTTYRLTTFDDWETLEYKFRLVKAWKGANSRGKQLGGVAFWSLLWLIETQSVDPNNTGAGPQSLTRTLGFPYTLMEELFATPGVRTYFAESFEHISSDTNTGFNARWREPEDGPDDQNVDATASTRAPAAAPAGAPSGSNRVLAVSFRFTALPGRFFFKHQPLMGTNTPYSVDWGNALVHVSKNTKFLADIHVPSAYAGTTIRMVVRDANNQLEKGPAFNLTSAGWRQISFDLANDPVTAYTTSEGAYSSGNGVIDTAGGGARDITFAGFEISSTGFSGATGTINFDRILYQPSMPNNRQFVINEFRYATASKQFVEIAGPAGVTMPAGLELRTVSGFSGQVVDTVVVGGNTIPASGLYLVGASDLAAVRNQALPDGMLRNGAPNAIQLYDPNTGITYDSVVYQAAGGLNGLDGPGCPIVADFGPPWLGEVASGTSSLGDPYSAGRYPDGATTWVNGNDFSFMVATPGLPNGAGLTLPVSFNFESAPPQGFQTFQTFAVVTPPASVDPGNPHGKVYRCVDTSGGGVIGVIGDSSLGANGNGYQVTGEIYIPGSGEPAQAIGIGICGTQGSRFFPTASPGVSSYENGYWLIFENASGVGLNDGRPDHPGTFEFVQAVNDGNHASPTVFLGSKTLAQVGVTGGTWTTFRLAIDPNGSSGNQLIAQINNVDVYRGPIPAEGRTKGAFQIGFRENHTGAPAANEGTWIDNVTISPMNTAVSSWELY
ncbi:spore peptidoglycan hydrolase (N-acetylglucosaminidase) [Candidatus Sumerlaea chitinivorans]|uniref:chitinase n=1 Tax=Sumerlaea chitinivorans TaxID=2250252 RepID=A0A2Z4Y8U3_SUMC1|nr:spore peptidoglycan hydrolase (N-acetylglucosaminidase) [Candidatus Sumerlaea chitinivorans]